MAIVLFIDGENFKGKIRSVFYDAKKDKPVWHQYDFKGLLDNVLKDITITRKVFYFARVKEHPDSKEKSLELIEEQRLLKTHLEKNGFEVILSGRVRGQMEQVGGKRVLVFKEKGVDVKIAVDMVAIACDGDASEIILASSDSDLQPAIKETIERGVKCIYLGFESQPNKGISYTTNHTILIRNSEVMEFEKIKNIVPDFVTYLKSLTLEDWDKMVTPHWTVKDVIAHMVGWERRDAEIIRIFWETKKKSPWMETKTEWDEFNRKEVEKYKKYTPQQLLDEWEIWRKKVSEEIGAIGYQNIKSRPDLFDWLLEDEGHYTLNDDGTHYKHHHAQIKSALEK